MMDYIFKAKKEITLVSYEETLIKHLLSTYISRSGGKYTHDSDD